MTTGNLDAVVVGAGPNGLTAAARLARAGRRVVVFEAASTIGGGSRTSSLTDDSRFDVCAAVHPFGASSVAFEELRLGDHGLRWLEPPIGLAHPFDDGGAALLRRDVAATAAGLGADGPRWQRLVGRMADDWAHLRHLATGPVVAAVGRHPLRMARFGLTAAQPSSAFAHRFSDRGAAALIAGLAAHSGVGARTPTTAGVAVALAAAGHATGMPFAAGGSQSIVDALASVIRAAGGEIVCDHPVRSLDDLPVARALLLDLTPGHAARLLDRRAPRWHHGVAAWKLDLLLDGPMPWTAPGCAEAGTVHLGGERAEIEAAERATNRGAVPEHPFLIVTQPSVVDPSRARSGQHVIWAYRHVPNGLAEVDPDGGADAATRGIEAQFDRFAPGWRDLVVHRRVTTAIGYERYNPGYVGGDIGGGAMTAWQTIARPRLAIDPYRLRGDAGRAGSDGAWLCSQSTPPGPGVHGMCGWHAAGSVLRRT